MLQLKDIKKSYTTGEFTQTALDGVDLSFRESEFVAILGPSGSGKTTLLNIIGGLDRYDTGDLVINGKSTSHFKDGDWDAYRNNSVGFIFQSYNLISHLSIVANVEMGMTLSGVSSDEKRKKALEVLERVGLKDHVNKKPNQLSGGQMQRVAIARALANNPDIILADEPTGALDTQTSKEVMDLIKEIAKDKLVIMVTHNPELAEEYADRIVKFRDGKVKSDSNPYEGTQKETDYKLKKTSMSFFTALKLSFMNIRTKKWRTLLTAFASSIGIIGIALILSLSNGFDKQIKIYETETLSNYPITIAQTAMDFSEMTGYAPEQNIDKYTDKQEVNSFDLTEMMSTHNNVITESYVEYVEKTKPELLDGISYGRSVQMNLLKQDKDGKTSLLSTESLNFETFPSRIGDSNTTSYLSQYYDVLAGELPKDKYDTVLVVDEYNQVFSTTLDALGLGGEKQVSFDKIVGTEFKLLDNNDYYEKVGNYYNIAGDGADLSGLYHHENAKTLRISGIIRIKEDVAISALTEGIVYSDELAEEYIATAKESDIVRDQKEADYNVLTGNPFAEVNTSMDMGMGMGMGAGTAGTTGLTKESVLASLGDSAVPSSIYLYPINFDAKEEVKEYLDAWNEGKEDVDRIEYTDYAEIITSLSGSIMSAITMVLIAFAAISLVVSLIMIGIITYISVLERTKEIGILRALGARKKDITRVFNAETFIIGTCSGLLGILIAYLLTIPTNIILYNITELSNVAQLNPVHAITLVIISVLLTMLGGLLPARMAAKKDPVEALRTE